tara:strand:- start:725 stop:1396 length:672 start_codon:yes stop_codon:yes gene_type:complete
MNEILGESILFSKKPKKLIFLLHGYGDNATNFIPLAKSLNSNKLEINFFAPNAPSSVPLYPTGRQWFNIFPNEIHKNKTIEEQKSIIEKDCQDSFIKLQKYISDLCNLNNLSHKDCFLIGFSQGAMIAYELGFFEDKIFAGCIMLSGRVLSKKIYKNNNFVKTPLLIIHGDEDEIIKPSYFTEACEIAKLNNFNSKEYLINGVGHTISPKILELVENFLQKYM